MHWKQNPGYSFLKFNQSRVPTEQENSTLQVLQFLRKLKYTLENIRKWSVTQNVVFPFLR